MAVEAWATRSALTTGIEAIRTANTIGPVRVFGSSKVFQDAGGPPVREAIAGVWRGHDAVAVTMYRARPSRRPGCLVAGALEIPASSSPVVIEHRRLADEASPGFALEPIELEAEAFNRAYIVRARDAKCAEDLIDARLMAWLLDRDPPYAFVVAGGGAMSYTWLRHRQRVGSLAYPQDYESALEAASAFVAHIPRVFFTLHPAAHEGSER